MITGKGPIKNPRGSNATGFNRLLNAKHCTSGTRKTRCFSRSMQMQDIMRPGKYLYWMIILFLGYLNLPPGSRKVLPPSSPLRTGREGCPFIRLKPLAFVASPFGDVADGTRGVQGVYY